jgi:hypothetical protein
MACPANEGVMVFTERDSVVSVVRITPVFTAAPDTAIPLWEQQLATLSRQYGSPDTVEHTQVGVNLIWNPNGLRVLEVIVDARSPAQARLTTTLSCSHVRIRGYSACLRGARP